MPTDFVVEKDSSKAEIPIRKTRLMSLSGHNSWPLGYNIFYDLYYSMQK